ncbi:N-acetylmuramoyl-L-alanine amidase [bacterium]|nr:N-acetylmuramoyl-L-alanine amidase [bacterium]
MEPASEFDPIQNEPEEPQPAPEKKKARRNTGSESRPFTFLRGLQTTLAAAFVVATLFTLWTPGSFVDSSLEVRMAQALQSSSGEETAEAIAEATLDPAATNIGIVAGHYGYNDPGAVCANGTTEAEVNLEIATLVQKSLADMGYQVDLLEEFDDRLDGYKGSVLISIHLDSCDYINDQATGFKVAAALSEDNQVASQRLTTCLSDQYAEITGLPYHAGSVTDDMTYYHAFSEIDPQTTAAIIEAGFMNMDYSFITEQTDRVAEGIVAGILCFLNN